MSNNFDILEALWLRRERKRRAQKIIEGAPPLTFKAKEGTLKNYRIYGNTVDGASVGDLVTEGDHAGEYCAPVTVEGKNLFDGELAQGYYKDVVGSPNNLISSDKRVAGKSFIPVSAGSTMVLTYESTIGITKYLIYYYNNNKELIDVEGWVSNGSAFTIPNNVSFIRIVFGAKEDWASGIYDTLRVSNISNIMLNSGSTAPPYEPYHAPVTTPIYLPEQIRKVGDEAEYIDYGEQKQHFADGTSVDVTLPALPTIAGTNTLSVGTQVQPSKVMVRGKLKE